MPIPNRTKLMQSRRELSAQYHKLCELQQIDDQRRASKRGIVYSVDGLRDLRNATFYTSSAIDAINRLVGLPEGS